MSHGSPFFLLHCPLGWNPLFHMLKHIIYRPSKSLLQIRINYNQRKSNIFFFTQIKGNKIWYETGESRNLFTYPVFMTSTLTKTYLYSSFDLKFPYAVLPPSNMSFALLLGNLILMVLDLHLESNQILTLWFEICSTVPILCHL